MLNKEICKMCVDKNSRCTYGWNMFHENDWNKKKVMCPALKACAGELYTGKLPTKNCYYFLEQIVSQNKETNQ